MAVMHLLRGLHNPGLGREGVADTKCVATIGNFDGVHLGHQAIIRQVLDEAERRQLPSLIIIFEPQPMEFFKGNDAPPRLMRFREKYEALATFGLNYVFCLKFDRRLSQLSAFDFVKNVLVDHLNIDHLVVGDDFRFGGDRQGDYKLLCELALSFGFTVENNRTVLAAESDALSLPDTQLAEPDFNQRASSTLVRELLSRAEFVKVEQLLGRPYTLCGRIAHGQKLGRQLGYPTANIHLKRVSSPLSGVYAVTVHIRSMKKYVNGVANVGCKPTLGQFKPTLEVHLLNFKGELYGEFVEVRFHKKLREEQRFENISTLQQQISRDSEAATHYFAQQKV